MNNMIQILDTTLRDGAQMEGISLSIRDKINIAHALDDYGIKYIEGGFPGSNEKDKKFFEIVKNEKFKNAKICAFGSTRYKKNSPEHDPSLNSILYSGVEYAVIFGKTWDFHVIEILETNLEENLNIIYSSIEYLTNNGIKVIFDAEHFFDGFNDNPKYAIQCLLTAEKAGAINLSLCDTNGGMLPMDIDKVIKLVKKETRTPLGFHGHNDSGCADSNSCIAVKSGVELIHTTVNGYGERTGNANTCVVIPNLVLKMHEEIDPKVKIETTKSLSILVSEVANLSEKMRAPYVGHKAFTHKAGIHASGMAKNGKAYEHINPALIGNSSNIIVSELSGKSNIIAKAKDFGFEITSKSEEINTILKVIKEKEKDGFHYEGADASLYLLMKKIFDNYKNPFSVIDFLVVHETNRREKNMLTEATVKVGIWKHIEHTVSSGNGPVNALDLALRKALIPFFPEIEKLHLIDFKVRILDGLYGTSSITRVLIDSKYEKNIYTTVGASGNIIEASFEALIDAYTYTILRKGKK